MKGSIAHTEAVEVRESVVVSVSVVVTEGVGIDKQEHAVVRSDGNNLVSCVGKLTCPHFFLVGLALRLRSVGVKLSSDVVKTTEVVVTTLRNIVSHLNHSHYTQ